MCFKKLFIILTIYILMINRFAVTEFLNRPQYETVENGPNSFYVLTHLMFLYSFYFDTVNRRAY